VNGKKLVGLAVAHIPRGCRPSREIRLSRSDQVARRATRGALRSKVARGRAVARGVRNCRGGGRRMRRTRHKWYNMQYINRVESCLLESHIPRGRWPSREAGAMRGAKEPQVRYSAAYPTGRERIVFRRKERKGRKDLNHEIHEKRR